MERQHEDKMIGSATVATKEAADLSAQVEALTKEIAELRKEGGPAVCSHRWSHRDWQGRVCPYCDTAIPGGGMYTFEQLKLYFPRGVPIEAPRAPESLYSDLEAAVIDHYKVLSAAFEDAATEIDQLQRDRGSLPLGVIIDGQRVDISDIARNEAQRIEESAIPAAEKHRDQLRDEAQAWLQEHERLGKIRTARGTSAMVAFHEKWLADRPAAFLPAARPRVPVYTAPQGIGERISSVLGKRK